MLRELQQEGGLDSYMFSATLALRSVHLEGHSCSVQNSHFLSPYLSTGTSMRFQKEFSQRIMKQKPENSVHQIRDSALRLQRKDMSGPLFPLMTD